jgi:thiol-disulfide isomerase/thioredoxin/sugar lactone lactonase YvrE
MKITQRLPCLALATAFLFPLSSCQGQQRPAEQTASTNPKDTMELPSVTAPEINTPYGWLNTDKSYSLRDFRGKFVLLDFWTLGCINCQHIIPDLKRLEKEYPNELVVIGVHSAKFDSERATNNIRKAILKFGVEHPVVNDADYTIWQNYAVKAWPTVALVSPDGKVVGQQSGERVYETVQPMLDKLLPAYEKQLNRRPLDFKLEKTAESQSMLRFPSKMVSDEQGNLWLSDSGHNRILRINADGKILEVIGKGAEGHQDGSFSEATFYEPHGLALKENVLYIADTKNNLIRQADLSTRQVKTIAGDGSLGRYYLDQQLNVPVNPNSPWDLLIDGDTMYIANAGNHQILRMNLKMQVLTRFAGSGREALTDGVLLEAAFNQPSGLTKTGNLLYVADAEASAVRVIDLQKKTVRTAFGKGLFVFGDQDGDLDEALLQHNVGVTEHQGKLYVADTYNGKVKVLDLQKKKLTTFVAGLDEPNDVLFLHNDMWISDTNHHQLVKIGLTTNRKTVVNVVLER